YLYWIGVMMMVVMTHGSVKRIMINKNTESIEVVPLFMYLSIRNTPLFGFTFHSFLELQQLISSMM
ncbi:MAG: hypothetical protein AB2411_18025, partial [Mesobacillus sp.]